MPGVGLILNSNEVLPLTSPPPLACVSGYFMSDVAETLGQCLLCPTGSTSPGGSQSSCTCDAGLVTSAQQTTTTSDVCGTCATNYYRPSGACVMCPANSERMVGSDEASCSCTGGRTTTPRGTTTTSGAACNSESKFILTLFQGLQFNACIM